MPTPTYTPLATVTLGASASSVTFSSIPATYRDLILVMDLIGSTTAANAFVGIRLNSDTGNNYNRVAMVGTGSTTSSFSAANQAYFFCGGFPASNSNSRGLTITDFMDYSATDKHKTMLQKEANPTVSAIAYAARWANTSAVTSIEISATPTVGDNNFGSTSTFSLYGIAS
jgi:hypothetical protein